MPETEDVVSRPDPRAGGGSRPDRKRYAGLLRGARVGPTAFVAVAALTALVVWLVVESRDGSSSKDTASRAALVSRDGLNTLAKALGQTIYWVGPRKHTRYEVRQTSNGIYARYLPTGVKAGDSRRFLTIGTYSLVNAYGVMKASRREPGDVALNVPGGGIAIIHRRNPTSVYVAYAGSNYQIEVYEPRAAVARQLVLSGRVQPVLEFEPSQGRGPVAVSPAGLRSLAASLGHRVYWAGPRPETTYELTVTADGRTYIRYLPKSVAVGDARGFLTIGTYRLKHAYTVTKAGAKATDTVSLKLGRGGIAVYTKGHETNVHLAYPGADVQVEVYDPSPRVPPKLAAKVIPVR